MTELSVEAIDAAYKRVAESPGAYTERAILEAYLGMPKGSCVAIINGAGVFELSEIPND